jgi:hypothetical protein
MLWRTQPAAGMALSDSRSSNPLREKKTRAQAGSREDLCYLGNRLLGNRLWSGLKVYGAPLEGRTMTVMLGDVMLGELEIPDKPDPQYWRERAQTTRATAEQLMDPRGRRRMLGAAAGYERLAERIERHALKTGSRK